VRVNQLGHLPGRRRRAAVAHHLGSPPRAVTLFGPSWGEARVATSSTCPGPGRVDIPLGMATQVLLFEFRGPTGVLPKGVRRAVQGCHRAVRVGRPRRC
jgi:hypothetical protein